MKKRSQIDEKYKWDLSSYIKDENEIEEIFEIMKKLTEILPSYSGKLGNPDILLERLTKFENDFLKIAKLAHYLSHKINEDCSNEKYLSYQNKFSILETKLNEADAYFDPQMDELDDEYLKSLLKDERFKDYDNAIKDIIKLKPHKIDEQTSKLISKMGNFLGANSGIQGILMDSEIKYENVSDGKGKIHKLDNATMPKLATSKDGILRKNTFYAKSKAWKQLNKTFAEIFLNECHQKKFFTSLRKYDSVLDGELIENDVPKQVFDNIINQVNKNIPLLQSYVKQRKKLSKNKDFATYDLIENAQNNQKITIEQAKDLILNALAPLGEDYVNFIKMKFEDKSIDYLANENKYSGGYSSDLFNHKSLILMNYTYDYDSVSTLAHELGHAINSELFNRAQPKPKADITIFAAEIASTTNEILLNLHMQKSATGKNKIYYLNNLLEDFRATVFVQTLFSEFELFVHNSISNDQPLTYADLNSKFLELYKKYYSNSCFVPKEVQYGWQPIHHFYRPYYVYTYATGMITAINIANKILTEDDFSELYIKFLQNGTSKPAVEALKEIGIDLTTGVPYENAFKFIEKQLTIYKSLCK